MNNSNDLKEVKSLLQQLVSRKQVYEDEFLNLNQACEFLCLKKPTIYSHTSKQTIPHFKRGKKLMFSKSKLIDWMAEGKVTSISELKDAVEEGLSNIKTKGDQY